MLLPSSSEVVAMGRNGKDIGPDWKGAAGASNQLEARRGWFSSPFYQREKAKLVVATTGN
jgi:hypothetical protein